MPDSVSKRSDFVLLFDVMDGNPNGDPDAGNLPRVDAETGEGIVTDVCLKRKVRNFVELATGGEPPNAIYIKEKTVLNRRHQEAYEALGRDPDKPSGNDVKEVRRYMCDNYFDVRTFGAVMSTGVNAGQVRGPVQLTFGRSVGPIVSFDHSITRMAVTNERDLAKERTMGRKSTVPYGLYRAHGFISAPLARDTGFSDEDQNLLLRALAEMFEHDRSAARGMMSTRGLYVFDHDSELGSAPAHALFDRVRITRGAEAPRSFSDFNVRVDEDGLPGGVTLRRVMG
ncbi:MAG: type I-C CRISPR-associated protein Cas7/Csd2 [Gammaproteobacteria bacterium]|nr:type I-C CRISPR-associated protein Cas7/Csd2 [Gammaproteobacteria bacterium]MDE0651032.1 type I-C CRISPR-associated protein Cas7/Csd2 [Gammaproteobacteria bacterium]